MKNRRKKNILFIVILLVAFLGIGYAYLTTTLSINGVTDVDRNSWDVYFDNVQVDSGSVTGEQVIEAPTITSDTEVEFHIRLKEPGDYYVFTIDAKNDGTIDAMINSVSKTINGGSSIPSYLYYEVKYIDGLEIENNHLLASESLETYLVIIQYRNDINPSDLPSTAQSLTLSFGVEYVQADSNAKEVSKTVYSALSLSIGDSIPYSARLYDTAEEFSATYGMYFKYDIRNNTVLRSYAGINLNGTRYYLQGAGATYNDSTGTYNDDSIYYDSNLAILHSAFGEENCNIYEDVYQCNQGTNRGYISHKGYVGFANQSGAWRIESNGDASIILYN